MQTLMFKYRDRDREVRIVERPCGLKTDILTIFSPEKLFLMNTNLLIGPIEMSYNVKYQSRE